MTKLEEIKERVWGARKAQLSGQTTIAFDANAVQDIEYLLSCIADLTWTLKQFSGLQTVVAPDGRRWPIGLFAQKMLEEHGLDKE